MFHVFTFQYFRLHVLMMTVIGLGGAIGIKNDYYMVPFMLQGKCPSEGQCAIGGSPARGSHPWAVLSSHPLTGQVHPHHRSAVGLTYSVYSADPQATWP